MILPEFNNVLEVAVDTDPYPHIVVDDLFDQPTLADIGRHWPAQSLFKTEVPGVKFLVLNQGDLDCLDQEDQRYWIEFMVRIYGQLIKSVFTRFSPALIERYPNLKMVEIAQFRLMETDETFGGLDPHFHYFHEPTWLFTNLIYIDDDGRSSRGTTLCWPKGAAVPAMAGYDHEIPAGSQVEPSVIYDSVKTIDFVPNRLLSFLDTAKSFHSVLNAKSNNAKQRRRLIRVHISAPAELIQSIYGVSQDKFREIFKLGEQSKEGMDWRRNDVEWANRKRDYRINERHAEYVTKIAFGLRAQSLRNEIVNSGGHALNEDINAHRIRIINSGGG